MQTGDAVPQASNLPVWQNGGWRFPPVSLLNMAMAALSAVFPRQCVSGLHEITTLFLPLTVDQNSLTMPERREIAPDCCPVTKIRSRAGLAVHRHCFEHFADSARGTRAKCAMSCECKFGVAEWHRQAAVECCGYPMVRLLVGPENVAVTCAFVQRSPGHEQKVRKAGSGTLRVQSPTFSLLPSWTIWRSARRQTVRQRCDSAAARVPPGRMNPSGALAVEVWKSMLPDG